MYVFDCRHTDIDRDRGASASISTEDGSIAEQREGRQLRKRHSPAKMTSCDETSLCSGKELYPHVLVV